uniref:Uncharacterized protein n=1 Tax=Peronospora matthiolae TaxID=2874970 RepID=A0AAV1T0G7_9STRA
MRKELDSTGGLEDLVEVGTSKELERPRICIA